MREKGKEEYNKNITLGQVYMNNNNKSLQFVITIMCVSLKFDITSFQ